MGTKRARTRQTNTNIIVIEESTLVAILQFRIRTRFFVSTTTHVDSRVSYASIMQGFSGAVKIAPDALNDYIAPSQDCVVALDGSKVALSLADADVAVAPATGELITSRRRRQPPSAPVAPTSDEPARTFTPTHTTGAQDAIKVSLSDCLACSGCVTSAESVLLEQQSVDECLAACARCADNPHTHAIVVSISAQSRASLCAAYGMSDEAVARALSGTFKSKLGAARVYDTSYARDVSLAETYAEFSERMRDVSVPAPMLASACPGWVCYAEKTHGELALPHMSTTKSPQQIMGTFVKTAVARDLGVDGRHVYHISVMPCYDKKLEASREDFVRDGVKDVDVVLTTGEASALFERLGMCHLRDAPTAPMDPWVTVNEPAPESVHAAPVVSSSGAYAEYVFRRWAAEAHGVDVRDIEWVKLRNSDMREAVLSVNGNVVLRVAVAYGFRNIQNMVRSLKVNKSPYAFVEVMACPSGCLNGGGQIPAREGMSNKDLVDALDEHYRDVARTRAVTDVGTLYREWIGGEPGSAAARDALRTRYHARKQTVGVVQINNW